MTDKRSPRWREAYPKKMKEAEQGLIGEARKTRQLGGTQGSGTPLTGVGLSGGGIRSATFCLGLFQGLAKLNLLKKIDYLSTVSGGGYFGSFYMRLFTRPEIKDLDAVRQVLADTPSGQSAAVDTPSADTHSSKGQVDTSEKQDDGISGEEAAAQPSLPAGGVLSWLRENGRYLSPNGAGDLLLGGAVMLRNWFAVQVVLVVSFLTLFLAAHWLRHISLDLVTKYQLSNEADFGAWILESVPLWGSPYWLLAALALLLGAAPLAWVYWLVGRWPAGIDWRDVVGWPLWGVLLLAGGAAGYVLKDISWSFDQGRSWQDIAGEVWTYLHQAAASDGQAAALLLLVLIILTLGWFLIALWMARGTAQNELDDAALNSKRQIYADNYARHWTSVQLKRALVVTAWLCLFTAVDSLGQTLYLSWKLKAGLVEGWAAGIWAGLVGLAALGKRIAVAMGWADGGGRPKWVVGALLSLVAVLVVGSWLATVSFLSNVIVWKGQIPQAVCQEMQRKHFANSPEMLGTTGMTIARQTDGSGWDVAYKNATQEAVTCDGKQQKNQHGDSRADFSWLVWALPFGALLSWLMGQSWPFLNRSSHQPLYSSRLTRAYLGASNRIRLQQSNAPVTRVVAGDDLDDHEYWPWPPPREHKEEPGANGPTYPHTRGAPLHLINTTVNETVEGRSHIQQQDRKGIGLAAGPAGLSAGIRHHTVLCHCNEYYVAMKYPRGDKTFSMLDYEDGKFTSERLTIGQWLSISGAAISTGLGSRTSLALSLLTGFANVRLGYWWDSGVAPKKRVPRAQQPCGRWLGGLFSRILPVQAYLLDEYTARFHGSARRHWYLTDGGHFENLGGYELIRRRLPLMVVVDAEADPDYEFGGLANLIRKARIDFGAEIRFCDDRRLDELFGTRCKHAFGTLDDLKRGRMSEEMLPYTRRPWRDRTRVAIDAPDNRRYSLAHAALAEVRYADEEEPKPQRWLVYIKPTLVGSEPADLLQYHAAHPHFPQEPTSDQFFDEAQWESYRKLGEHIAEALFRLDPHKDAGSLKPWEE